MLGRDELEKLMPLKGLSIAQTEKDYIQNLLLYVIYSVLGRELVFKGGTCCFKYTGRTDLARSFIFPS